MDGHFLRVFHKTLLGLMSSMKKLKHCASLLFTLMAIAFMGKAFALEENEKFWFGVYMQKPLSQDDKWLYSLYTQSRFINKSHPWQVTLLEGGLGYRLYADTSLWVGYRWSAQDPNNGFYQVNMLFQQMIWRIVESEYNEIVSRSRLEEIKRGGEGQLSLVYRQRFAWEKLCRWWGNINPMLYDEGFFQLNRPSYAAHRLFTQNRLFVGIKWYVSSTSAWEIGYINQYQFATPQNNQNQMNHIASVTYILS
jgi:hypothetical protein